MELSCKVPECEQQETPHEYETEQHLCVGDYFFIDFSIENKTNIRFDIDEIRVKLADKKVSKATNAQIIELTPALVLEQAKSFRHGYRNVIVVKKMTFPKRQGAYH